MRQVGATDNIKISSDNGATVTETTGSYLHYGGDKDYNYGGLIYRIDTGKPGAYHIEVEVTGTSADTWVAPTGMQASRLTSTSNWDNCCLLYTSVREVSRGTDDIDLKLLLKPGSEAHSYEPTPQDIIAIQNCDVFIYVGGESDEWVKNILSSIDTNLINIVSMMDCVELVKEETVEGMEEEKSAKETYEPEYDEHVWTSPRNAIKIVDKINSSMAESRPVNKEIYNNNKMCIRDRPIANPIPGVGLPPNSSTSPLYLPPPHTVD